jgi:CheY-like chemotaxis protein
MSTVLAVLVILLAFLVIRRLAEERIACNSCLVVVSKRRVTTLADGRLICRECLNKVISSTLQGAISQLPGAQDEGAFALEPNDSRIGEECALCSQMLQPLDPVCAWGDGLSHLVCTQLARRLPGRSGDLRDKKKGAASILVVDDEAAIREIISSILRSAGYKCRAVAGGLEALALLDYKYFDALFGDLVKGGFGALASPGSSEKFDLLLTDMLNHPLDGFTLLQCVKDRFPDLPVVVASALDDKSVIQACINNGASEYLVEPFEREQLLATVSRVLKREQESTGQKD